MNKFILTLAVVIGSFTYASAQKALTAIEKKMTDSLCNCINRIDVSKVTTQQEAVTVYTNCINQQLGILQELAEERNTDMTNVQEMQKIGITIAQNLVAQKCDSFMKLSSLLANKRLSGAVSSYIGTFKRIDTKGFNYAVITVAGSERSLLWLKQFPNSELLMTPAALVGKKVKITYYEYEAYLPQAKGYYNVKEITGMELVN